MKTYRSKASAYNMKANQNITVMNHLIQKQNIIIGRLRGQIGTQFLAMNKRIAHLRNQIAERKEVSKQHKSLSREHKSMLSQHTQEKAKIEREIIERQLISARIEKEWGGESQREDTLQTQKKQSLKLLDQSKEPSSSFSQVKIKNQYNNIIEMEDDEGKVDQSEQLMIGTATETPGIQA